MVPAQAGRPMRGNRCGFPQRNCENGDRSEGKLARLPERRENRAGITKLLQAILAISYSRKPTPVPFWECGGGAALLLDEDEGVTIEYALSQTAGESL